jgi:hypothetical protein
LFYAVDARWSLHKPAQLSWLTAIFGGFDQARVWHFWLMIFFIVFVIPHVVLVIADGWDTLRSMITAGQQDSSARKFPIMSSKQIGAELKSTERSALLKKFQGAFSERPIEPIEVEPSMLRRWTRRDVLLFGAGALATLAVGGSQLPRKVLQGLGLDQGGTTGPENKWLLNKALRLDDEVSTLLYSQHHLVPTYTKSQTTPLKNNYNGATPDPAYIPGWRLTLDGQRPDPKHPPFRLGNPLCLRTPPAGQRKARAERSQSCPEAY